MVATLVGVEPGERGITSKPNDKSFQRGKSIKLWWVKMRTGNPSIGFAIIEVHSDPVKSNFSVI